MFGDYRSRKFIRDRAPFLARFLAALQIVLMASVQGCARKVPVSVSSPPTTLQASFSPAEPRVLDTATITVQLPGPAANLPSKITANLNMPAMDMGTNKVELASEKHDRVYKGNFQFTMAGTWIISVPDPRSAQSSPLTHTVKVQ